MLIILNVIKIKKLEYAYNENIQKLTIKLNSLNTKISKVVNVNNEISIQNIKSLISKLDNIETVTDTKDTQMNIEMENLKSKLNFLMDNSEIYSLMNKDSNTNDTQSPAISTSSPPTIDPAAA
jgi:hypothetical protein